MWTARLLFGGLLLIELLVLSGILHLNGEYNWFNGMVITATIAWVVSELNFQFAQKVHLAFIPCYVPLLATTAVYLDAFGDIFHWYGQYPWYDQLTHATGSMAAACALYFFYATWSKHKNLHATRSILLLITATTASCIGALYEIEEYLEDHLQGTPFVRLGGGTDTADDLLYNTLGIMIAIPLNILGPTASWNYEGGDYYEITDAHASQAERRRTCKNYSASKHHRSIL